MLASSIKKMHLLLTMNQDARGERLATGKNTMVWGGGGGGGGGGGKRRRRPCSRGGTKNLTRKASNIQALRTWGRDGGEVTGREDQNEVRVKKCVKG